MNYKKCRKQSLLLINIFVINLSVLSQPYDKGTLSMSIGAEVLFTEAKLSSSHHNGYGATSKAEYVLSKHASITILSGYYYMKGRNKISANYKNIYAVPLKAGGRYYFGNFYGSGEAGAIFFSNYNRGTGVAYSLGLGDKIKLGNQVLDIGLRHEGWSVPGNARGIIGLRVSYEFAIKRK